MDEANYQKITTADGSDSVWVKSLDETYHSRHGAVQEAKHVFIESGLLPLLTDKDPIRVFEVGFGTGLNAILTWIAAHEMGARIEFHTVEKYPLPVKVVEAVNYRQLIPGSKEKLAQLHRAAWDEPQTMDAHFSFCKWRRDLDVMVNQKPFDLVMYDAFGPRVQPNMWQTDKIEVVYNLLADNGVLVTYCAQGQFRRNLKAVGFEWESLPGPPGKREMTRAAKSIAP